MSDFVPGLELARLFFEEAVQPLLATHYPDLTYGAALIGTGSEVLGFDTPMSSDHSWGPRLQLFLRPADHQRWAAGVTEMLGQELPFSFRGYPTHFETLPDDPGSKLLKLVDTRPIQHRVEVLVLTDWLQDYVGWDGRQAPALVDWLVIPEQKLRTLTAGAVFRDDLGELAAMRAQVAYYPDQVWRYLLACQWGRIGQEEPFVGRTGSVGDDTGSAVLAARLVRDLMRLAFLQERVYAPYSKWFGTGFARLQAAAELGPHLDAVLRAGSWRARERHLIPAYELMARRQADLGLSRPIPTTVSDFHSRPFQVIQGGDIAWAIADTLTDERLRRLPPFGKADQFIDSTDVLSYTTAYRQLAAFYGRWLDE